MYCITFCRCYFVNKIVTANLSDALSFQARLKSDIAGNLAIDNPLIVNMLSYYFSSAISVSLAPTATNTSDANSFNENSAHFLPNFEIAADEVLNAFKSLKANKSPGRDNI